MFKDYDEGTCLINVQQLDSNKKRIVDGIGYLPEEPNFYPYMTALDYLKFIEDFIGYSSKTIKSKSQN